MITINLINKEEIYDSTYHHLEVNGIHVVFVNKMLTGISKGKLTADEEQAAVWFVNSEMKIQSSVIDDGDERGH